MNDFWNAVVLDEVDGKRVAAITQLSYADLPDGDVTIDVSYSSLNFKDGLAVTGRGKIARSYPLVCGIDLVGTVSGCTSDRFAIGDSVVVTGWELSERYNGGFTGRQRVKADFVTRLPDGLSALQSMAIGTAGITAMLAIMALEDHAVVPTSGEVVVTGAAGGVGSVGVALLAALGYTVVASTGRASTHDYLTGLGASRCIERSQLSTNSGRPLDTETWAGAIDNVGGETLASLLRQTKRAGCVAACGLAGSSDLPTTVMPFILRGVTLAGIDSVLAPASRRAIAWQRIADCLPAEQLASITTIEPMSNIIELGARILAGEIQGRTVIDVHA